MAIITITKFRLVGACANFLCRATMRANQTISVTKISEMCYDRIVIWEFLLEFNNCHTSIT